MTNPFLYVKIYGMKAISIKFKTILILLCLAITCSLGATVFYCNTAFAENSGSPITKSLTLSVSESEVFDFNGSSPVDALSFNGGFAVRTADNKVYLSKNGVYTQINLEQGIPAQIKMLDNDTLLVLDGTTLYQVDIETLTPVQVNYPNTQTAITGSAFDCNGDFIAVRNANKVFLFNLSQGQIVEQQSYDIPFTATDLTPVCVDANGKVYYVNGSSLYRCFGSSSTQVYTITGEIRAIDCYNDDVYFIEYINDALYLKAISGGVEYTLTTQSSPYDLGEISAPNGITVLDNGDLLVSDATIGAVQQFSVDLSQSDLSFTGIAIAKNKTAYNRISNSTSNPVIDVERYGDTTAIFSSDRITVINHSDGFSPYNKERWTNIFASDLAFNQNAMPDFFALGNGKLLFAKNYTAPDNAVVNIYSLGTTPTVTNVTLSIPSVTIHDVCYQSGYFYILANSSSNTLIFKINESDCQEVVTDRDSRGLTTNPKFTVDVLGNYHLFADSSIIKMVTDLNCDLFALKNDGIYKYDNEQSTWVLSATCSNVISFTMSFDDKSVILIESQNECVYSTLSLDNLAINGTSLPADYKTTDINAEEYGVKFYKVNEGSTLYSVINKDGKFEYVELVEKEEVYILICEVTQLNHYALVGQNGVVLVSKSQATLINPTTDPSINLTEQSKIVYVTTDVNLYYFPIITMDDTYVLYANKGGFRVDKKQELYVSATFTFLDKEFYLVTYAQESGQVTIGYVPTAFTTDKLSEDYVYTTFTIETTKKIDVFSHNDLSFKVFSLNDGDIVRLYKTENGVCQIEYFENGMWKLGYISKDAIKDTPNTTIRNVLIILAVTACLCGTITYFVMRKKEN